MKLLLRLPPALLLGLFPFSLNAQTTPTVEIQSVPAASGGSEAAPVPAPTPTDGAAVPKDAAAAAAEKAKKNVLTELKKIQFTRNAAGMLEALANLPEPAPVPQPGTEQTTGEKPPAPDEIDKALTALRKDVAAGRWDALGAFLRAHFAEKPEEAKQAYLHVLTGLSSSRGGGAASAAMEAQMQEQMMMIGQGGMPRYFMDGLLFSPDDVLNLAAQAPADPDPDMLGKLGGMLQSAVARGNVLEGFLKRLEAGAGRLGGADPAARLRAARLLVAASLPVEAAPFLTKPEEALAAGDSSALNLMAVAAEGRHARDGRPEDLESAWKLTRDVLAIAKPETPERPEALRRAVLLATRVRKELGGEWLKESFTTRAEVGMEILAGIGRAAAEGRMNRMAEPREANLELQKRAVTALLESVPGQKPEWTQALTTLAVNWMIEAKYSQERDASSTRGPQMQYDMFGNVFFGSDDMMMQQQQMRGNQVMPVKAGRMLDLAPDTAWIAAVDPALQPAILRQMAELHLKVKAEKDAYPFIEKLAVTNPAEARELAERFIEVWGENHDPNSEKRRTNRYMYIYGYNPQADGIPLTRSKQGRDLEELAGWVEKLRKLPGGGVDEEKIAQAFLRIHSQAEVYRMEDVEKVFGEVAVLKPETLASVLGTMRQNLGGLWRAPKVQQDNNTKRKDKEIVAEVMRGYSTAASLTDDALEKYPDNWRLHLIQASLRTDENNYRNEQQKTGEFAGRRTAAFAQFAAAARLYAEALPKLELKEQSADVYTTWFYSALGAPDLEGVKPEHVLAQQQIPLIREAILALPGEAAERHMTLFANTLATRMSAAAPAVKHTYLTAGLEISGAHERARPARELLDYYSDLVTEIQLQVKLDGPDRVGTTPFGVFVNIRHTKQIEREAGGFQKYLQNQNNQPGFYNFGRPLENYRDKFEETVREALKESFDVLSVTFHPDKVESRGEGSDGWRITPYCYLLVKAKGPQTDAFPPLKLSLDFMDTSGYAVLPVVSPKLPLDAAGSAPRPVHRVEVTQILDERRAGEGLLGLEIKATGRGLLPPLEELLVLNPGEFTVTGTDDQGLHVTQVEAATDEHPAETAVTERLWNISLKRDPGSSGAARTFTFAAPKSPEIKTTWFRYADADLKEVPMTVDLLAKYGAPRRIWPWVLAGLALLGGGAWWLVRSRRSHQVTAQGDGAFAMPEEITVLSVIGLLRRIRQSGRVQGGAETELDRVLKGMEMRYYAPGDDSSSPDLAATAREWLQKAGA